MPSDTNTIEYPDSGRYEDCFIAFLDILGFKKMVLESHNNRDILQNIIESMNIVGAIPSGGKKVSKDSGGMSTIQIRRRFFSDTLVFFLKEDPEDIAQLFFVIRYIQDRLWERGICLRGSIVRGQMYWTDNDDNITVGEGIIDAYECESSLAIYPRIIVSKELYDYIKSKGCPSDPFGIGGDLAKYILEDYDGITFLDLLNPDVIRKEGESIVKYERDRPSNIPLKKKEFTIEYNPNAKSQHMKVMGDLDEVIKKNIDSTDEKIRQKYAWLKTYRSKYNG